MHKRFKCLGLPGEGTKLVPQFYIAASEILAIKCLHLLMPERDASGITIVPIGVVFKALKEVWPMSHSSKRGTATSVCNSHDVYTLNHGKRMARAC